MQLKEHFKETKKVQSLRNVFLVQVKCVIYKNTNPFFLIFLHIFFSVLQTLSQFVLIHPSS